MVVISVLMNALTTVEGICKAAVDHVFAKVIRNIRKEPRKKAPELGTFRIVSM